MKRIITLLLPLFTTFSSFAQPANVDKIAGISGDTLTGAKADTSWKTGGFLGINFSQVSLNNWAQGGENSIAIVLTQHCLPIMQKAKLNGTIALHLLMQCYKPEVLH